jgi:hypothetical protein
MKAGYIDEISNWIWKSYQPPIIMHRRREPENSTPTTPRLKQYLRELITRFEGLARGFQTESGTS